MALPTNPDKGTIAPETTKGEEQIVMQPGKAPELANLMEAIDTGKVSEIAPQRVSEQGGSLMSGSGSQQQDDDGMSPRDLAIRNLPSQAVMQREIASHITQEIRNLRRETKKYTRLGKPGQAYKLAKLYARIRQMNGLIAQVWDASYDVVKRLFIRIFIDKQTVL